MIQIYSERNSCSNYLKKLIELNMRVDVKKSHQFPKALASTDNIILVKNPYSWLLSLHKKPHGSNNFRNKYLYLTFSEFLNADWCGYNNAIERYNEIMLAYIDFLDINPNAYLLNCEELQENPEQTLKYISEATKIKSKPFKNIEREVNSGGNLVEKFTKLDYYKNEEWRSELSKADINHINSIIDKRVFTYFDYKRL